MEKPHMEIRRKSHITETKMNRQTKKRQQIFLLFALLQTRGKNSLVQHSLIYVLKSGIPNPSFYWFLLLTSTDRAPKNWAARATACTSLSFLQLGVPSCELQRPSKIQTGISHHITQFSKDKKAATSKKKDRVTQTLFAWKTLARSGWTTKG